jgi:hypothetical protein
VEKIIDNKKRCPVCYGRGWISGHLKSSVKFKGKDLKLLESILITVADNDTLPEKDIARLVGKIYRPDKSTEPFQPAPSTTSEGRSSAP